MKARRLTGERAARLLAHLREEESVDGINLMDIADKCVLDLVDRVNELEAALQPFAEAASDLDVSFADDDLRLLLNRFGLDIQLANKADRLAIRHIRAARDALKGRE